MKKVIKILIFAFIIVYFGSTTIYAENEEILESQKNSLNISDFISESQKYTDENLDGLDIKQLLNSAITGKIENEALVKNIFNIFGKEVKNSIKIMRKYYNYCINT